MHKVVYKQMKCLVVIESTVQIDGSVDEVVEYLRERSFRGDLNIQVNMNQGGITNVTSRQHVPITLEQAETLCQKA